MSSLSIRETRHYNTGYRHLDKWLTIGTFNVLASTTVDDDDDLCEGRTTTMLVCVEVEPAYDEKQVERALSEEFSGSSCQHEYDCCGCRSFHATAEHLSKGHYKVVVSSSRNY